MKKLMMSAMAMMLAFSACTTAMAADFSSGENFVGANGGPICGYRGQYCQFVDEDGDGICDNYGTGRCGMGLGNGTGFIDADGDGICDNRFAGNSLNGTGLRQGGQRGRGGNGRRGR